jgi:hypothetical protein
MLEKRWRLKRKVKSGAAKGRVCLGRTIMARTEILQNKLTLMGRSLGRSLTRSFAYLRLTSRPVKLD